MTTRTIILVGALLATAAQAGLAIYSISMEYAVGKAAPSKG